MSVSRSCPSSTFLSKASYTWRSSIRSAAFNIHAKTNPSSNMKRTCRSHGLFERNFCRMRKGGSCVNGLRWELITDKAIYRKSCYSLFFISPDISFSVYFVCEWRVRQSFCKIFCSPLFYRAQVEFTIYLCYIKCLSEKEND